jgi:hypothetical protein
MALHPGVEGLQEQGESAMKIKVYEDQMTKAIKRLVGIEVIIDTVEEARKGLALILERTETAKRQDYKGLKDIKITQKVEHPTTAVEHKLTYILEFILEDDSYLPMEIALIQELQRIFQQQSL